MFFLWIRNILDLGRWITSSSKVRSYKSLQYYLPLQVREPRSRQWTSLRRTFKCLPPNMNTLLPNRTAVWAARAEGLGPCHPKQIHKLKIRISPNQIHESKFQHINLHKVKPLKSDRC